MRPLPRLSPTAALLAAAPAIVACVWGVYFGAGGLSPGATELISACATLAAAVVLAIAALGWIPIASDRTMLVAVGGLAIFGIVAALSATWSLSPASSIATAMLGAAYVSALVLGWILGPALPRPGTWFSAAIGAAATVASAWAIVARSFAITTSVQFTPRLSGTLSLPNAMAVTALAGTIAGMVLTSHRNAKLRALGGAVTAVNALALVLTSSRSGLGLALIAIATLQLVLPASRRMRLIGIAAIAPPVAIGLKVATWSAFTDLTKIVASAGWRLTALALIAVAASAAIAAFAPRVLPGAEPAGTMRRASRRTCAFALAGVGIAIIGVVISVGGPGDAVEAVRAGFTSPVGQTGVRIGIGSNFRDHWWATAWSGFADAPLGGSGAGTFRLLEQMTRTPSYTTGSTHNTILEVLSGTGLVGALPFLASGLAILALGIRGIRRAKPGDGPGATALALMTFGLMGQGLVDVDWSLVALGVPLLAGVAAIAATQDAPATSPGALRVPLGALAILLAAAGLFSAPFWYSARAASESAAQLDADPLRSLELASIAHRLNPLAVEPLLAQADAYANLGDEYDARRSLIEAIRLEPRNYEPWLAYGTYLAYTWNDLPAGRSAIEHAVRLSGGDPGAQSVLDTLPSS